MIGRPPAPLSERDPGRSIARRAAGPALSPADPARCAPATATPQPSHSRRALRSMQRRVPLPPCPPMRCELATPSFLPRSRPSPAYKTCSPALPLGPSQHSTPHHTHRLVSSCLSEELIGSDLTSSRRARSRRELGQGSRHHLNLIDRGNGSRRRLQPPHGHRAQAGPAGHRRPEATQARRRRDLPAGHAQGQEAHPRRLRRHRRRPRGRRRRRGRAASSQGASGRVAAGEVVPEELLPDGGQQDQGQETRGRQQQHHRSSHIGARERQRRRLLREGEHGRRALPEKDRHADVQGVQGAQGGPGGHVRLLLGGRQRSRQPLRVRHHLRGQGRRPHARRRRALRHVQRHLQEAEDHQEIRSHRAGVQIMKDPRSKRR